MAGKKLTQAQMDYMERTNWLESLPGGFRIAQSQGHEPKLVLPKADANARDTWVNLSTVQILTSGAPEVAGALAALESQVQKHHAAKAAADTGKAAGKGAKADPIAAKLEALVTAFVNDTTADNLAKVQRFCEAVEVAVPVLVTKLAKTIATP